MPNDKIRFVDSHTGGEPTRVITGGFPPLTGTSIAERIESFRERYDNLRRGILNEPRGFPAIVGALVCEPENEDCDAGVIFFNNKGYLEMCGHGIIGLVKTLLFLNKADGPMLRIDTVAGIVEAAIEGDGSVTVANVPSYRLRKDVEVNVPGVGVMTGDIAWGGNWFFICDYPSREISMANLAPLTALSKAIMRSLGEQGITGKDGAVIDHIELSAGSETADSRNFVLCPGGEYDRSPCGTGTSAKIACLASDGVLAEGEIWKQEGVCGSVFSGSYRLDGDTIFPSITGSAHITAEGTLYFHESDPFRYGLE